MSTEPKSVGLRTAQDNVDSRAAALRSAPSSQPDKASCEQSEKSQGGIPINRPGRLRSASRQATVRTGALLMAIMGFAVFTLLGPASQWIEDAPENLRAVEYKLRTLREPIRDINYATEKVQQITGNGDGDALQVQLKPPHLANIVMNTTGRVSCFWSLRSASIPWGRHCLPRRFTRRPTHLRAMLSRL